MTTTARLLVYFIAFEQIVAPSEWTTNGDYIEVGVDVADVYTVVKRTYPTQHQTLQSIMLSALLKVLTQMLQKTLM